MELTSLYYLVFITITLIIFNLISNKIKPTILIISSLLFIGLFSIDTLFVFLFGTLSTHFITTKMIRISNSLEKKIVFRIGLIFNISLLFIFKFIESNYHIVSFFDANKMILFVGISFFSLQNIAYLIDNYYNRIKPSNLSEFILFNSFFPKFIAGPITKIQDFKFDKAIPINSVQIQNGINRIALGLLKKMVIADRIAPIIAHNFEETNPTFGLTNLVVAYLFTIQLYFDFSGYSDIAIGSAKLFGIQLPENFNFPLNSKSIGEFWRKWHITLSSWLTNYVFYPISFRYRKLKYWGIITALTITFLLSGIWHGIGLTFLIYALSHALYLIIETFIKKPKILILNRLTSLISIFLTFNLVSLSFVFFRATSIEQSFHKLKSIFSFSFFPKQLVTDFTQYIAIGGEQENIFNLYVTIILTALFLIFEKRIYNRFNSNQINIVGLIILLLIISFFGIFDGSKNFIYSQF